MLVDKGHTVEENDCFVKKIQNFERLGYFDVSLFDLT